MFGPGTKKLFKGLFGFLAVCAVGFGLWWGVDKLALAKAGTVLTPQTGKVLVRAQGAKEWQTVSAKFTLAPLSSVRTTDEGFASITLPNGGVFYLAKNTEVALISTDAHKTVVNQLTGYAFYHNKKNSGNSFTVSALNTKSAATDAAFALSVNEQKETVLAFNFEGRLTSNITGASKTVKRITPVRQKLLLSMNNKVRAAGITNADFAGDFLVWCAQKEKDAGRSVLVLERRSLAADTRGKQTPAATPTAVPAKNSAGESTVPAVTTPATQHATTTVPKPVTLALIKLEARGVAGGIKLTWETSGYDYFLVLRDGKSIMKTKALSFFDQTANFGEPYEYVIVGRKGSGQKGSNVVIALTR